MIPIFYWHSDFPFSGWEEQVWDKALAGRKGRLEDCVNDDVRLVPEGLNYQEYVVYPWTFVKAPRSLAECAVIILSPVFAPLSRKVFLSSFVVLHGAGRAAKATHFAPADIFRPWPRTRVHSFWPRQNCGPKCNCWSYCGPLALLSLKPVQGSLDAFCTAWLSQLLPAKTSFRFARGSPITTRISSKTVRNEVLNDGLCLCAAYFLYFTKFMPVHCYGQNKYHIS